MSESEPGPEQAAAAEDEVSLALIRELDEGELVSVGGFTLDQTKAVAKLGAFRLADPNTFVLLFVEAAVLFNCTQIDIDQDGADTSIRLAGVSLDKDELRRLPDAPFATASPDAPLAARRLDAKRALAFGLVTASKLGGARCALHSRGPKGEWTLAVAAEGEVELEQLDSEDHPPELRLVLSESAGLLARAGGADEGDERSALRRRIVATRCRHAPIIVRVDGKRYDRLRSTVEFEPGARSFEAQGVRGRVGRSPVRRRATIVFVANGVVIEEVELDGLRPGIAAIVDASALARDLSLFRLRRDESFEQVVAVTRAQLEQVPPGEELAPLRLPGVESSGAGEVGGLRVWAWLFMGLALVSFVYAVAAGVPLGYGAALILVALGSGSLRTAKRRARRQGLEQGGILGLATIEYVLSGGPTHAPTPSGQPMRYTVRAQVEAPGIPVHVQTLSFELPAGHEPPALGVPYYARLDPAAKVPAVLDRD